MGSSRFRAAYTDPGYRAAKDALEAQWVVCAYCRWRRATSPDHVPPLSAFEPGCWVGQLVPSCLTCNKRRGGSARQLSQTLEQSKQLKRRPGTFGRRQVTL